MENKVHHIIDINEEDEYLEISKKFDAKIKYRPICIGGGKDYRATIIDTIKIINTVDGSSYEVIGECDIINPSKYGKKIKQLNIESGVRPIVNVYNKKISNGRNGSGTAGENGSGTSSDSGLIVINKGGEFMIENNSQNITSFIECTNVGVSIMEISPDDIN